MKEECAKLKPCPFCGGKAKMNVSKHAGIQYDFCEISCEKCCASIKVGINVEYSAKDKAIETWNRRANE